MRLVVQEPVVFTHPLRLERLVLTTRPHCAFVPITLHGNSASLCAEGCLFQCPKGEILWDGYDPFGEDDPQPPVGLVVRGGAYASFTDCRFVGAERMLWVGEESLVSLCNCTFAGVPPLVHIGDSTCASEIVGAWCEMSGGKLEALHTRFDDVRLVAGHRAEVRLHRCDVAGGAWSSKAALDLAECEFGAGGCRFGDFEKWGDLVRIHPETQATFWLCEFEAATLTPRTPVVSSLPVGKIRIQACLWNGELAHKTLP